MESQASKCAWCLRNCFPEKLWDDHFRWTDEFGSRLCNFNPLDDGHEVEEWQARLV